MALSEGDEPKGKYVYINLRVEQEKKKHPERMYSSHYPKNAVDSITSTRNSVSILDGMRIGTGIIIVLVILVVLLIIFAAPGLERY
jgi:hypothetical protein